ncbi:MAG: hypothetical protein HYU84_06490 [Chloroflexi bacterium]|nr:hypothetical protein [Chloroflexota bacterium]MBI3167364.1 hypothetical protein [Chloroflexota bacterium]
MLTSARLITPDGKMIELSPELYRKVQQLLEANRVAAPARNGMAVIRATHGKYAGNTSLTQALLKQKRSETSRENNKLGRRNG